MARLFTCKNVDVGLLTSLKVLVINVTDLTKVYYPYYSLTGAYANWSEISLIDTIRQ